MSTPDFTDSQWDAIRSVSGGVLVSAAAGSGKTATLAHRVAHLVTTHGLRLDQILVLTYTDNAAAEMRSRIEAVLRDFARNSSNISSSEQFDAARAEHTERQSMLVPRAPISTIHAFCARLIREQFETLGLDPSFSVLQGPQATLLAAQCVRQVLDDAYVAQEERPGTSPKSDFALLLEYIAQGDDRRLEELVLSVHRAMSAELDPDSWRERALKRLSDSATLPSAGTLFEDLTQLARTRVESLLVRARSLLVACEPLSAALAAPLKDEGIPLLEVWLGQINDRRLLEVKVPEKWQRAPSVREKDAAIPLLQEERDKLRKDIKQGPLPRGLPVDAEMWKQAAASSLPMARELVRLAGEFDKAFRAAKDERHELDFADLERFALRLLRDRSGGPTPLARSLQDRFEHVLIDESQDINSLQDALLSLVSRDRSERPSNLFTVGDIKQSIYRFRLAEPELFLQRQRDYLQTTDRGVRRGKVILLKENFRTRKPLIKAINSVFSRLLVGGATEIQYSEGQELVFGARYYPNASGTFTGGPIELNVISPAPARTAATGAAAAEAETTEEPDGLDEESPEEPDTDDTRQGRASAAASDEELEQIEVEARFIARRIKQLLGQIPNDAGTALHYRVYDKSLQVRDDKTGKLSAGGLRPLRCSDIAILLRSAAVKSRQMSAILRREGIAVHSDARGGLLELQEVRDVIAVLELIDNPERDLALVTFLRSPLARCPLAAEALARARAAYPDGSLATAARLYAGSAQETAAARDALAGGLALLARWREASSRLTVADTLELILAETHYLTYLSGTFDGPQKIANVAELMQYARTYCEQGNRDVSGFVSMMRLVDEQAELDQPSVAPGEEDVVRVLTIHKSKGLEYPVVFVPDLGKRFNDKDQKGDVLIGRQALISIKGCDEKRWALYPSPAWLVARERTRQQTLAEELRVLYVAMTRAREQLILVGSAAPSRISRAAQLYRADQSLSDSDILSVGNPLEWLLMAVPESNEHVRLVLRDRAEFVPADPNPQASAKVSAEQASPTVPGWVIALKPAPDPSPAASVNTAHPARSDANDLAEADRVIERVGWVYPHADAASRGAAISVTALTHSPLPGKPAHREPASAQPARHEPRATTPDTPASAALLPETPSILKMPRFVSADTLGLAPTERGTATHLALEHFDFARHPNPTAVEIAQHLDHLVRRRVLTPPEAAAVEVGSFQFLAASELAPLLRGERGGLFRELPIYLPRDLDNNTTPSDPMDRQMIRGRIDLLVNTAQGPVIIDYKTDEVWGTRLEERIEQYRGQVELYRRAATALTGKPCAGVYLAFVSPRARYIARL